MRVYAWIAAVGFAAAACASGASAPRTAPDAAGTAVTAAGPAAADLAADLAITTFDSAWSRIAHSHYDTAFAGVDWHGVRAELRPDAAAARTMGELRAVIQRMLDRLGESHFVLIPREAADALADEPAGGGAGTGDAGLEVRLVDGDLVVWRVAAHGAAAAAGVPPGWLLLSIDGRELAPRVAALRALPADEQRTALTRLLYQVNAELGGAVGEPLVLRLRDGAGHELERRLVLRPARGELVRFGNLPPMLALLQHDVIPFGSGGCAGTIQLNVWVAPLAAGFERAVDESRHCAGIVIDLRGNPGGVAGMVMGIAGHFLAEPVSLGVMRTRTGELRFRANPRRVRSDGVTVEPYAGRLAILLDEMSASTSEVFAGGLQALGRARIFGSGSAGQALPAMMVRLPTGDVLMHVVADFTGPDGVRIEGRGVVPDVPAASTRADLLELRDVPLDAALAWIAAGRNAGSSL
jgi:carboxyl-terminal processing protease